MTRLATSCRLLAVFMLMVVSVGCASSKTRFDTAGAASCEGLMPLQSVEMSSVCIQEGSDGAGYTKAVLEGVDIQYRMVGTSSSSTSVGRAADTRFPIGPQQRKELETQVVAASDSAMEQARLAPDNDKGADVLLIRGHILDVFFEAPTDPKSGAKYLFDAVGRATFVVELIDSESNELLLRAIDDRATDSLDTDPASQGLEIGQIASLWGAVLLEALGHLRAAEDVESEDQVDAPS